MLQVNCLVVQKIKDKVDGLTLEDVIYHVNRVHALIMDVTTDAKDEERAKGLLLKYLSSLPEVTGRFLSIKVTDEKGNII